MYNTIQSVYYMSEVKYDIIFFNNLFMILYYTASLHLKSSNSMTYIYIYIYNLHKININSVNFFITFEI